MFSKCCFSLKQISLRKSNRSICGSNDEWGNTIVSTSLPHLPLFKCSWPRWVPLHDKPISKFTHGANTLGADWIHGDMQLVCLFMLGCACSCYLLYRKIGPVRILINSWSKQKIWQQLFLLSIGGVKWLLCKYCPWVIISVKMNRTSILFFSFSFCITM